MSDSHGKLGAVTDVIEKNLGKADIYVHLGDGEYETDLALSAYPHIDLRRVAGNCDIGSRLSDSMIISVGDARIFAAHGHRYGVKYGLDGITRAAAENGCNIVLFGHTHERFLHYEDGIYYMNPGSCALPRDGKATSYGFIDITDKGIFTAVSDVN